MSRGGLHDQHLSEHRLPDESAESGGTAAGNALHLGRLSPRGAYLSIALALAGLCAIAVAFSGWGGQISQPLTTRQAVLLIVGCDAAIVALTSAFHRRLGVRRHRVDLPAVLSSSIANVVFLCAVTDAAVVALFGNWKETERLGYFLALLVLAPLCVSLAWGRSATDTDARRRFSAFATLAATAVALCATRVFAHIIPDTIGTSWLLVIVLIATRSVVALTARFAPLSWLQKVGAHGAPLAPVLIAVGAAAFIPGETSSFFNIAVALAVALAVFLAVALHTSHRVPRAVVLIADIAVLVAASLVLIHLEPPVLELAENHDYFLGPAFEIDHGRAMLVGTFSQYGVGMLDALAALFLVIPIGYGTFTLVLVGLTLILFVVFYVVLRWSTRSLLIAAAALVTYVVLDMFGQLQMYTWFPSTGVLRFGLPWLLVLFSLAAARWPRRGRVLEALVLVIVAVGSVWSGEDCIYCLVTAGALVCLKAALVDAPARERVREAVLRIALLVAASASGVLIFTLATRVATGVWPYWGGYLTYIRLYTLEDFGDLLIEPWSPGIAIGALYTASAVVIALLVITKPSVVRRHLIAFRAATGVTALGIVVYSYFLGRSHPNNVIHISPPAIALVFIWLGIVRLTVDNRRVVASACAAVMFFGALTIAGEIPDMEQKSEGTALASLVGAAPPLGARLDTLASNPVVEPSASEVVRFVRTLKVPLSNFILLARPQIESEALLRLGATNAVGSINLKQEEILPEAQQRIKAAISRLRPGCVVVVAQSETLLEFEQYIFYLLGQQFAHSEIGSTVDGAKEKLQAFLLATRR